jgi:poly(ADP-ribose) glycohydrolase
LGKKTPLRTDGREVISLEKSSEGDKTRKSERGRERERMESREDLESILPYLPLLVRSSSLSWPSVAVEEALKAMGGGPDHSMVDTGEALFIAITALRRLSPCLSSQPLASSASHGYAFFFDELMSEAESAKWFGEVVPALANLLLRLPSLLEAHYQHPDYGLFNGKLKTGLRLLGSQEPGMVVLSQVYMYPMFIFFSI